jgi:hypothetical protein
MQFKMNVSVLNNEIKRCDLYFHPQHELSFLVGTWYEVGEKSKPSSVYYDRDGLMFRNTQGFESDPVIFIKDDTLLVTWRLGTSVSTFNVIIKQDPVYGLYMDFTGDILGGQWWRTSHKP